MSDTSTARREAVFAAVGAGATRADDLAVVAGALPFAIDVVRARFWGGFAAVSPEILPMERLRVTVAEPDVASTVGALP